MIDKYITQINDLLKKIQEEDNENMETIIGYATSTEQNVGSRLCRYGEIYKLVFYSTSFDDIIYKLETLFWRDKYECYTEEIEKLQNMFVKGIKENKNFDDIKSNVLNELEHEYIFETILNCL